MTNSFNNIPYTDGTPSKEWEEDKMTTDIAAPGKDREKVIQDVDDEIGFYDEIEYESEVTVSGKALWELRNLAVELMAENDTLDQAAHDKTMEIIALKKTANLSMLQAVNVEKVREAADAFDKLYIDEGIYFQVAHHLFARWCNDHRKTIRTLLVAVLKGAGE